MSRLEAALRIGGIFAALIGVTCLPLGFGVSPKRDSSLFSNLADMGAFIRLGFGLIALGVIGIGLSYVIPGESDDSL